MYFKGVNRGMAFTKPGFYLTGLVCLAGVLATGSGSNALFLTLGLGLSFLVVSGMLSEKVMHNCSVVSVDSKPAEAGVPFSIPVRVENRHASVTCYGLEIWANRARPRYKLLPSTWKADFAGSLMRIAPKESVVLHARTAGCERGRIRTLFLTQTTLFPFNLVRKFKVYSFEVDICVGPVLDSEFLRALQDESVALLQMSSNPQEFHVHRPFNASDSHRRVDWRKSTSADPATWTVKTYKDVVQDFAIVVSPRWDAVASLHRNSQAKEFESLLARVHTACVFASRQRQAWLEIGRGVYLPVSEATRLLAELPVAGDKSAKSVEAVFAEASRLAGKPVGTFARLIVDTNEHHWSSALENFGGGS